MKTRYKVGAILLLSATCIFIVASIVKPFYAWGSPLLENRDNSDIKIQQIESSVFQLDETIITLSQMGEATTDQVDIEMGRKGSLSINSDKDYIDIELPSNSAKYPDTWTLIKGYSRRGLSFGTGEYGIQGENTQGVVAVKHDPKSDFTTYRVEFRDIRTSTPSDTQIQRINLINEGNTQQKGNVSLTLTNEGTRRETEKISSGQTVDVRYSLIDISLQ